MSDQPRIVAFAGSARKDSLNLQLVKVAAEGRKAGPSRSSSLVHRQVPRCSWKNATVRGQASSVARLFAPSRSSCARRKPCPAPS